MQTIKMDLPSDYTHVELIDVVLVKLLDILGYDEDKRHWMSAAVREAAVNAHKHGNKEDGSKRITFEAEYASDGRITVYVGDEGTEELKVADHFGLKDDLLLSGGRGIFFMSQFTSEPPAVEYLLRDGSQTPHYTADGSVAGKRLKLVKYKDAVPVPTSSQ